MDSNVRITSKMSINPFIVNNLIDSCAFDPKYYPENEASAKILHLADQGDLAVMVAHSVQKEIEHRNTPIEVKRRALNMVYTKQTSLTKDEFDKLNKIKKILAGNGKIDNIEQDAQHVFEAQKYGSYFITTDKRILSRRDELKLLFSVHIVKPTEFLLSLKGK